MPRRGSLTGQPLARKSWNASRRNVTRLKFLRDPVLTQRSVGEECSGDYAFRKDALP